METTGATDHEACCQVQTHFCILLNDGVLLVKVALQSSLGELNILAPQPTRSQFGCRRSWTRLNSLNGRRLAVASYSRYGHLPIAIQFQSQPCFILAPIFNNPKQLSLHGLDQKMVEIGEEAIATLSEFVCPGSVAGFLKNDLGISKPLVLGAQRTQLSIKSLGQVTL